MKKFKHILKMIDNKWFNGRLKKIYKRIRRIGAEPFYNIEGYLHRKFKDGKIVYDGEIAVRDIILSQFHNDDYDNYRFVNGVVELLAIENYYEKNDFGFKYYNKMQEDSYFDWESRFKNLIESYDKNGFDGKHFVQLAKDFAVMDGSHRIMLAWYHKLEFIWGKVYKTERDRVFNIDFFWKKEFAIEDCYYIENKRNQLLETANYLYTGVIWPPAYDCAEDILNDIEAHNDGITVVEKEMLELDREDFIGLFKGLYHTDILDDDGMQFKIGLIDNSMDQHKTYRIVRFKLSCINPRMSMNRKNYMPQSETISRIKWWVRGRYKRSVKNYEYDVIMHIADNYLQSKFCESLFNVDKDISDLFIKLDSFDYVVTRIQDVDSQHLEFPQRFYYRSNCNILITPEQKEKFVSTIYEYCYEKYNKDWYNVENIVEGSTIIIKLKIRDFMFFQFEIEDFVMDTVKSFIYDALQEKGTYNGIKVLDYRYEIIIRLLAYIKNTNKQYHLEFVKQYFESEDLYNLINKYMIGKSKVRAERLVKGLGKNNNG